MWQFNKDFLAKPTGFKELRLETLGNMKIRKMQLWHWVIENEMGRISFQISMKEEFRVSNRVARGHLEGLLKLSSHSKCSLYVIMYLFAMAMRGGWWGHWQNTSSKLLLALSRVHQVQLRAEYGKLQRRGRKREAMVLSRTRRCSLSGTDWEKSFTEGTIWGGLLRPKGRDWWKSSSLEGSPRGEKTEDRQGVQGKEVMTDTQRVC